MTQNLGTVSDAMVNSSEYWAKLANYILLYDQIIIPTGNLQIISVLRFILGEDAFDDLIRNKVIVLVRFDQWFGYAGNGAGLCFFRVDDGPKRSKSLPNLGTSFFKPLDEAISQMFIATNPPSTLERKIQITNLLLDNIITLPTQKIANDLKEESYKDILNSAYLRDCLAIRNAGRSLDNLIGIKADNLMFFNPHVPSEPNDSIEIRAVLRVAFENFLLSIGGHVEVTEITGDDSTLNLLRAKGQRLGLAPEGTKAFTQLQQVNGVPNIGNAYATKQLSSDQLLDLRYSKNCQNLRDWFNQGSPSDNSEEILNRYVESIGKPSWIDSVPSKLLRFVTTVGLGTVEPISGALATAIDTFMLNKWFANKSPRLFMEQAKVMLTNSPVIQKPVMRGRDRNLRCNCGSGKKFKNCCGR
ncbi:MAG: SEC-C domain-containing protein [Methylovulum miyakonense]|uniref:SEC-C domain-containing protein n=1 Tax=Methylovulum miyakonense TaxID=645578 RepID=UPI003BB55320